jgi:hypothetical protein
MMPEINGLTWQRCSRSIRRRWTLIIILSIVEDRTRDPLGIDRY